MLFFMPNLYFVEGLPITAPLSVLVLFWALIVKIVRDPDEDPAAFRLLSVLLVIASVLYIVPQIYGLEAADQAYLGDLPSALISSSQPRRRPADLLGEPGALRAQRRGAMFVRAVLQLNVPEPQSAASETPGEAA